VTPLLLIPAIDLQNGEAVRLTKGDFAQKTVYSADPAALALRFVQMGVKVLHIVDLDGAKEGETANTQTIRKIRQSVKISLQVGGGIRTAETVALYLEEISIDRIILGTAAAQNLGFVRECISRYTPKRIVVGVDCRNGRVATGGWLNDSGIDCFQFIEDVKKAGVRYIVVTDIVRDGKLTSPNWPLYEKINGINVIVSGGVANESDIEKAAPYYGVIVGKAFYEGKLDLEKCMKKE